MPNTGRFDITRADAACAEAADGCVKVTELRAQCLSCSRYFLARLGAGLESMEGGVVISCSACGARQGVSTSLFEGVTTTI